MITHISPAGSMDLLSQLEVERLKKTASSDLYQLYRNCTLAVLNSGSHTDNSKELLDKHQSFDVNVVRRERGIKLELTDPPEHAFVDGEIIKGIQEHLFSVLRDIVYVNMHLADSQRLNLTNPTHITNLCLVFCVTQARSLPVLNQISSSVGAAIQSMALNTNTRAKWVTSLAYVNLISVRVVDQVRWKAR